MMHLNPLIPMPILIAVFAVAFIGLVTAWILSRDNRIKSTFTLIRAIAMLALSFVIAVRPMREEMGADVQLSNLDILFVLDTTLSMWAEDSPSGTRMDDAIKDINKIMDDLEGANFGLISFRNTATVLSPFTQDEETVRGLLRNSIIRPVRDNVKGSKMDTPYYDLENMLISSTRKENRQTIVFFLSDGEITSNDPVPDYKELGQFVEGGAVLGYGTEAGGYMKDDYGIIYDRQTYDKAVSCIDEDNLKSIAEDLGIRYVRREKGNLLTPITAEVKASGSMITERRFDYVTYQDTYYKYVPYLAGLLILELFIRIRENAKVRVKHGKKQK